MCPPAVLQNVNCRVLLYYKLRSNTIVRFIDVLVSSHILLVLKHSIGTGTSSLIHSMFVNESNSCVLLFSHARVCVLLQAANSYLRDQWFHSLQWKVSCQHHWCASSNLIGAAC